MISSKDQNDIRVINEEYERVLSNPDNIIVSEELQELIDMPLADPEDDHTPEVAVDTLTLTMLDSDGLAVGVRGELSELSHQGDVYTISVDSDKVRREFLKVLSSAKAADSPAAIMLGGLYESEINDAEISVWSVEKSSPHSYRFTVKFRSENGIF